jgi:phospholipase C
MTTTLRIRNVSSRAINVATSVSPTLGAKDWTILAPAAPARSAPTAVLSFDRDEGITHGKTWTFTTSFVVDGVPVRLEERVTGELVGSTMSQSMTAGSVTTGMIDTNDPRSITFKGASGATYELAWSLSGALYKDILYALTVPEPAYRAVPRVMEQIETVVVLMLENRSLDNVLGWLYAEGAPRLVFPPGSPERYDGIPAGAENAYETTAFSPKRGTAGYRTRCRVPAYDPNEPIAHVAQQLYADGFEKMPPGSPWASTPPMKGFVGDYHEAYIDDVSEVMGAYSPEDLPILSGLAKGFAVSDRWFSSVPTQTDPNRAFSLCGTSRGAETNDQIDGGTFADANTLFNVLAAKGKTWALYWQSESPLSTGEPLTWQPYTSYFYPRMMAPDALAKGATKGYPQFLADARDGKLPSFSYVEPYWGGGVGVIFDPTSWVGIQGTDYHPPAWIGPAEAELLQIYEALVQSPQWPHMLLVITFDEHGGNWDHVPPPRALPPDASVGASGFAFDRLGVRIPTILVSPFVEAGTVFRAPAGSEWDLDHTSLLATLCKWAGVDPASAALGARTAAAPTFEGVLRSTARTEPLPTLTLPEGYAQQGGGKGAVLGISDQARAAMKAQATAGAPARARLATFRAAAHRASSHGEGGSEELKRAMDEMILGAPAGSRSS